MSYRKLASLETDGDLDYHRGMTNRKLYIAAYDVRSPTRLRAALVVLKGYASGRQKSVFECFLTRKEKEALLDEVADCLNLNEDNFLLLRLSGRSQVRTLGKGVAPVDSDFFYIG